MFESAMMLRRLASLRLTVPLMLFLVVGILLSYKNEATSIWMLVMPLFALAVNLVAAILVNKRFHQQAPLLVFHFCLLILLCLSGLSQLSVLYGRLEIAEGQTFAPDLVEVQKQGPWHSLRSLRSVAFMQGPINVDYEAQLIRGRTRSTVYSTDTGETPVSVSFGDNQPFSGGGYRFYTTSNKGYAVILSWLGSDGKPLTGGVHFPSFPKLDWSQLKDWTMPDGKKVNLELLLPNATPMNKSWVLNSRSARGQLRVKQPDGEVVILSLGDSWETNTGTVRFDALRMWMGYEVRYVPYLAWMFVTGLLGVVALGWHFWIRFGSLSQSVGRKQSTTDAEIAHG